MNNKYWDGWDVKEWLRKNEYNSWKLGGSGEYVYRDDKIIIIIFPEHYPHTSLKNVVGAESVETFNKITQLYYVRPFPRNSSAEKQMLRDLKIILEPEHVERSDQFLLYENACDGSLNSSDN